MNNLLTSQIWEDRNKTAQMHTDRPTDKHIDRRTQTQTPRYIDTQTDTHILDRHTDTHPGR